MDIAAASTDSAPSITDGRRLKGMARRRQLVQSALEVFGEQGYRGGSLRDIAARVGISEAGILHHFGTKEALLEAVLAERDAASRRLHEQRAAEMEGVDEATADSVLYFDDTAELVRENTTQPGVLALFVRLSAEAIDPEHPAHDFFVERFRAFQTQDVERARRLKERGELNPAANPESLGRLIPALLDGLNLQYLMDPENVDMPALFDDFLAILRNTASPSS